MSAFYYKIRNYTMGPGNKQIQLLCLSGQSITGTVDSFVDLAVYAFPQSGILTTDLSNTSANVMVSGIYDIKYFNRKYSIDKDYDVEVNMEGPSGATAPIIDFEQIGDYVFNLTRESYIGQRYKLNADGGCLTGYTNMWHGIPLSGDWLEPNHQIVTYYPATVPSLTTEVNLEVDNTNFNYHRDPMVLGLSAENGDIIVFVKDSNSDVLDDNFIWPTNQLGYVHTEPLPFAYILEQNLNYNVENLQPLNNGTITGNMYVNPFKLKNEYDYDWETLLSGNGHFTYHSTDTKYDLLNGIRNYLKIGKTQSNLWLNYKYIKDYDYEPIPELAVSGVYNDYGDMQDLNDDKTNLSYSALAGYRDQFIRDPLQRYDCIEVVKGLYKAKAYDLKKSNVFSVQIVNSGLNQKITNDADRQRIQAVVESEIRTMIEKISPVHTELWKIIWKGN